MKHLAAYLLLGLGGNSAPSADDIKEVLSSVGIESDDERLKQLLSELDGKDIQNVWVWSAGRAWWRGVADTEVADLRGFQQTGLGSIWWLWRCCRSQRRCCGGWRRGGGSEACREGGREGGTS